MLTRTPNSSRQHSHHHRRSWRGRDCQGMDFSNLDLIGADFTDAILDGANFSNADVRGASFRGSSLVGANLTNIRAGVATDRSLLVKIAFIFLTVCVGIVLGLTGASISTFLCNETSLLAVADRIEFLVPLPILVGIIPAIVGTSYYSILFWKKPSTALWNGVLILTSLQVIAQTIIIGACVRSNLSWKLPGDIGLAMLGYTIMLTAKIVYFPALLSLSRLIIKADRQTQIALAIGLLLAWNSIVNSLLIPLHCRILR